MSAVVREPCGIRPRVLYLSCHLPYPAISGGRRRELELIKRIAERFDVHLLVVSKTPREDLANAPVLREYCREVEVFAASATSQSPVDRRQPPQVLRHRCRAMTHRVAEILANDQIDLIHVEGYYLMQHIPQWASTPLLLVEQNIEYELERQRAAKTEDVGAHRRFKRTALLERQCWARGTQVAAVTAEDAMIIAAVLGESRVRVVPDGADHIPNLRVLGSPSVIERPDRPLGLLLANFAYAPNCDAATYLHTEILPRVRVQVPDVAMWLVGNAPPAPVRALAGNRVTVTGQVPDVLPYLDAADVVLCPLRIGGGIKVKTIEALRRGKAIVSTSVGVQGLPEAAREALVVADDAADFAAQLSTLLLDPARRDQLERSAAQAARQLPSWNAAAGELLAAYEELLERRVLRSAQLAATGGSR